MTRRANLERPGLERDKPRELEIPRELIELYDEENLMGAYYLDETKKPEGVRYNWKRFSCYGKEDKQYQVYLNRRKWTAVPGGRHPEAGGEGEEPLVINGLMLMECPEHIAKFFDDKASGKNAEAMDTQERIRNLSDSKNKDMPRVVQKFSRTYAPDQSIPE